MTTDLLIWLAAVGAAVPLFMLAINLCLFRRAPQPGEPVAVSVLIPARNEEATIADSLHRVLVSEAVDLQVIVMDDHSDDSTAAQVLAVAGRDPRVRLEKAPPLPEGWCGKQHACRELARSATSDLLVWMDADVKLEPHALARMAAELRRRRAALVTAFPGQEARSPLEQLVVPLINWLLVSYLPMAGVRWTRLPAFAAGCGQLMMAHRAPYIAIEGHGHPLVRRSLHDGLTLPRAMRLAGNHTDLFDGRDIATCRMYHNAAEVWHGFAKNATEGMATPIGVIVWSVLLLAGHVLPWALGLAWVAGAFQPGDAGREALVAAMAMAAATSLVVGAWFGQPLLSVFGRPVGVLVLLAIQWYAFTRKLLGRPAGWRGRAYAAT